MGEGGGCEGFVGALPAVSTNGLLHPLPKLINPLEPARARRAPPSHEPVLLAFYPPAPCGSDTSGPTGARFGCPNSIDELLRKNHFVG